MKTEGFTRSQLAKQCGVPYHLINHLLALDRLPIIKRGTVGRPHIYSLQCVEIIRAYVEKYDES